MSGSSQNEFLAAALKYARRGWPVLALVPERKIPLTKKGFYDSTTSEASIHEWWATYPRANIGIRVGFESGICVIDVDNKGGKDGRAQLKRFEVRLGALPPTLVMHTPNGSHYYFRYSDTWRDALIKAEYAPGLDIKTKGYVVAPPSVINGFEYHVINGDQLAELPKPWINEGIKGEPTSADWRRLERPRGSGPSICDEYNIRLGDVINVSSNAHKTSEGYLIKHPIHGATGDGNLSLNMSQDLWHCFRHGTGGDPLTWIAVREGFIDCADAGPLDRETIKRCLEVLRSEGKVPDEASVRATVNIAKSNGAEDEFTVKLRRLDDLANVERFLSIQGNSLRWCVETRRWLAFNGAYWAEVSSDYVKRCIRDVASIIRHESALVTELKDKSDDEKKRMADEYTAWARTSSLKNRIDAVIELAKADLEISIHEFDRDPLLFNCQNGTFDIRIGELRPYDRGDYITQYCPIPYEPGFKNGRWEAFLERVQPSAEIRDFLPRAVGYSLTGLTNEEALFFGYGDGATGKSTFAAALLGIAASYGDVSKFATFLVDRTTSGGAPREDVTRLIGLRLTVCNEVNKSTRFNGALLKTLVSGDKQVARVPYSPQSVSFTPIFKLWMFANDRPKIEYDDDAAFRRFYVIPFDVVIPLEEQDKNLKAYFTSDPDAQKAILAWALGGAVEWHLLSDRGRRYGLQAPIEVTAATQAYQLAMSPVYEFIANECFIGCDENGQPFEEYTTSLWDAYDNPRSHYDVRKVKSAKALGKHLTHFGFESNRETSGERRYKYKYLRLIHPDEQAEPPEWLKECTRLRPYDSMEGKKSEKSLYTTSYGGVCDFCRFIRSYGHVQREEMESAERLEEHAKTVSETTEVKQAEFDLFVLNTLNALQSSQTAFEPSVLCDETVKRSCADHDINGDRQIQLVLGRRFAEFVSGEAAQLFLKLTGGKSLILGGM